MRVNCKVTVGIDAAKYKKLQDRMVYVLGALAKYQGTVDAFKTSILETAEPHKNAVALLRRRFLNSAGAPAIDTTTGFVNLSLLTDPTVHGTLPESDSAAKREYGSNALRHSRAG